MTVDGLEYIIHWKKHKTLFPIIGKPVKMRLHLRNATVYGFDVLLDEKD